MISPVDSYVFDNTKRRTIREENTKRETGKPEGAEEAITEIHGARRKLLLRPADRLLSTASMILNLRDRGKWYLDDFTIRTFYFDTWSSQSLRGFHALHNAADAPAVEGYDFNIVLAVKRLKCRKCFGDFHSCYDTS
jgi:hypothetical protein